MSLPLANRMGAVQASPIIAMAQAVRDKQAHLTADEPRIISFSIGVPGFLPPKPVYDAAHAAVDADSGDYLAGRGSPALVKGWVAGLKARGFSYAENEVCAQVGGKGGLFNLLLALLNTGDEVVIPAPYWTSYPEMVRLAGGAPVHPAAGAEQNYKITPAQLQAAITPRTKAFIFNNPSNPTGMLYTAKEVAGLAEVLAAHPHVWIISDDIYDMLVYAGEGSRCPHLLDTQPEMRDRTVLVNSISKTYGMPGWRVGLVAGPKPVIDALLTLTSQSQTHLPAVTMAAAAAALNGSHDFLYHQRQRLKKQRDMVLEACKAMHLVCPVPEGAFYAFPNIGAWLGKRTSLGARLDSDEDVCKALLNEAYVACVPGGAFGDAQAIRLSYAGKEADVLEGLNRISTWAAGLMKA